MHGKMRACRRWGLQLDCLWGGGGGGSAWPSLLVGEMVWVGKHGRIITNERNKWLTERSIILGWRFSRSSSVEKGKNRLWKLIRNGSSVLEIITELKQYWWLGNVWVLPKDFNKPRTNVKICYFSLFLWMYIELNVKYEAVTCILIKNIKHCQVWKCQRCLCSLTSVPVRTCIITSSSRANSHCFFQISCIHCFPPTVFFSFSHWMGKGVMSFQDTPVKPGGAVASIFFFSLDKPLL